MAHDVRPARDLRSFDATPHLLRRVTGDRARQTTVSRVQGEHLERAETRKVADCEISVFYLTSHTDIAVRYRRVPERCVRGSLRPIESFVWCGHVDGRTPFRGSDWTLPSNTFPSAPKSALISNLEALF